VTGASRWTDINSSTGKVDRMTHRFCCYCTATRDSPAIATATPSLSLRLSRNASTMKIRILLPIVVMTTALGAFAVGAAEQAGSSEASATKNPFAGKPEAAKEGRQIFLQTGCYNCHGLEAKGGGIAPDLTVSKLDPQQMFKTIHDGRPGTLMPSWGKELDADQIWKVITYLRSVRPAGSG
jgi:mono/diheme cytochrome c family protein